jgi:hypothetical protein
MVIDREPEDCDTITVILLKAKNKNFYRLITAYIGFLAEPEPWDKRSFNRTSDPENSITQYY